MIPSPENSSAIPVEVEQALEFVGIFSRVADKMGRSPHHVLETAKGRRQSKPVLDAIVAEVRRINSFGAARRGKKAA